jgi:hypothetical protein
VGYSGDTLVELVQEAQLFSYCNSNAPPCKRETHSIGETVVTSDTHSELPEVTAAVDALSILYLTTVTGHDTDLEISFQLPVDFGLPDNHGLEAGDILRFNFPDITSGAWLTSGHIDPVAMVSTGGDEFQQAVEHNLASQYVQIELPSDLAPADTLTVLFTGIRVPAVGADFDGAMLTISRDTEEISSDRTILTGNMDTSTPAVTPRIAAADVDLSNQTENFEPDEVHGNSATVSFVAPIAIPEGSAIIFSFPSDDAITAAATTVSVNSPYTNGSVDRVDSIDRVFEEDDVAFITSAFVDDLVDSRYCKC